jgi:hypothetical protein
VTTRGTLVLVAVLALVAVWLAVELRIPRHEHEAASGAEPLLATRPGEVTTLELSTPEQRLAAVRQGSEWQDAEGRHWPAAPVHDVVDTLAGLRPVMVVDPDPSDAGEYGLARSATRLRLGGQNGRTLLDLELGERNPAGTGVYARRGGRREILLVGAILAWELDKFRAAAPSRTLDR